MSEKYSEIAARVWPFLLPKIERLTDAISAGEVGGGGSVSGAPSPHALDSSHHSGLLASTQATQFALLDGTRTYTGNITFSGSQTVDGHDISAHVADPDAHHARATVGNGLGITGQELSLDTPGTLTSTSTNAVTANSHTHAITSSADGETNPSTLLQSSAAGSLRLAILRAPILDTASGNMTIQPVADLLLDPGGDDVRVQSAVTLKSENYASQVSGWGITYAGAADFRYVYADELHAKAFIADLEQALAGGQIITKSVTILYQDFTMIYAENTDRIVVQDLPSASGMDVFVAGDIIAFRQFDRSGGELNIAWAYGTVSGPVYYTAATATTPSFQSWNWTRLSVAHGGLMDYGTVIKAGSIVLDFGVSGDGYHEINAIDGLRAANSPYSQVVTWATSPGTRTVRTRLGNLTGVGLTGDWGLYALGASATNYLAATADGVHIQATDTTYIDVTGSALTLRGATLGMYDGTTRTVRIDADGNTYIGSDVSGAAGQNLRVVTTGTFAGNVLIGNSAAANMLWSQGDGQLQFRGASTVEAYVDTDGTIKAGGGVVILDSDGIALTAHGSGYNDLNSYKFTSGGVVTSFLASFVSASYNNVLLRAEGGVSDRGQTIQLSAESYDGVDRAYITVSGSAVSQSGTIGMYASSTIAMETASSAGTLDLNGNADISGTLIVGSTLTMLNNTALQMKDSGAVARSAMYMSAGNDLVIGAGVQANNYIEVATAAGTGYLRVFDEVAAFGGQVNLGGAGAIGSAPATAVSQTGWKLGLYSNTWAVGLAPNSLVFRSGANGWLAAFNNANPASDATTTAMDSNAYFGVNVNYLQYDGALGEAWTSVSSFGTNWAAAAGYEAPSYKKFSDWVMLAGAADTTGDSNANAIFTLPVGYRPGGKRVFAVACRADSSGAYNTGTVEVNTDGTIYLRSGSAGTYVALDTVYFTTTT